MGIAGLARTIWGAIRGALRDGIAELSAGVAFYALLAIFPGIAAVFALYSLFVHTHDGGRLLSLLPTVLPDQAVQIISRQVRHVAGPDGPERHGLGWTSIIGFVVLLWSCNKGIRALVGALNAVYGTEEKRGFLLRMAWSLAFTIGGILVLLVTVGILLVLPAVLNAIGLHEILSRAVDLLRWPTLLVIVAFGLAVLYRYGPARGDTAWRWVTLGSGVAAILWVIVSVAFSWTLSLSTRFDEIYGSLSAVIGFMIWIWLSTIVVLFGAELDSTAERLADT